MNDINKRLCELLGIEPVYNVTSGPCPHCGEYCTGKTVFCNPPIPQYDDFASPAGRIDLLKRLKEKGCFYEFLAKFAFPADFIGFLLDDNGALARVALEFLEGKEASHEG